MDKRTKCLNELNKVHTSDDLPDMSYCERFFRGATEARATGKPIGTETKKIVDKLMSVSNHSWDLIEIQLGVYPEEYMPSDFEKLSRTQAIALMKRTSDKPGESLNVQDQITIKISND